MAKRAGLSFDRAGLTEDLKVSTGRGVDALFSLTPGPVPDVAENPSPTPDLSGEPTRDQPRDMASRGQSRSEVASSPSAYTPANQMRDGASGSAADASTKNGTSHDPQQGARSSREQGDVAASGHAITAPRHHGIVTRGEVRRLRKAVKQVGKEAATYRFTREEKDQLSDTIHTCRRQGYRTSENEITRIAVNWLLEDRRAGGRRSVLQRVLRALKD